MTPAPRTPRRTPPRRRPAPAPLQRVRLDNGLVVVARGNRATRSVTVRLLLEAGAAFDPPGRAGAASLLANLLDRGAADLDAQAIADGFDFFGISYRARVVHDSLDLQIRLLAEHLPQALPRLRLLVEAPTFPEEDVRRERGQRLTALAERDQDTYAVADEALAATVFPADHPYHHPVDGTRASVAAITRDDLVALHRRRFHPAGSVLVVAGDLDPARAIDTVAQAFASWSPGPAGGERARFPDAPRPCRPVVRVRPIPGKTQADIALGIPPGLRRLDPDLQPALVFNTVVGDLGLGGRLGAAIREKAGLAYYAYAPFASGLGAWPFMARAGVATDKVLRAVRLMRRTLREVMRSGLKTAEIRDAKRYLAASIPHRFETNHGAAAQLADCEFYGLGIDYPERAPGLIAAVTPSRVAAAAERLLDESCQVLVVAGPSLSPEELS
jgi:zinc protease